RLHRLLILLRGHGHGPENYGDGGKALHGKVLPFGTTRRPLRRFRLAGLDDAARASVEGRSVGTQVFSKPFQTPGASGSPRLATRVPAAACRARPFYRRLRRLRILLTIRAQVRPRIRAERGGEPFQHSLGSPPEARTGAAKAAPVPALMAIFRSLARYAGLFFLSTVWQPSRDRRLLVRDERRERTPHCRGMGQRGRRSTARSLHSRSVALAPSHWVGMTGGA